MAKKKVFIGSSSENYFMAEAFKKVLQNYPNEFDPFTWKDFFETNVSMGNIEILRKAVEECSLSVFFATNDDSCVYRGETGYITRTNIWFEAGMFISKYGNKKVFMMSEDGGDNTKFIDPSDYNLNYAKYRFTKNLSDYINDIRKNNTQHKLICLSSFGAKAKKIVSTLKSNFESILIDKFRDKNTEEIYSFRNIIGRNDCYKIAEELINSAEKRIFSIVSYENELDDEGGGIFPYIKDRLDKGKTEGLKIKRWMNLGSDNIAKQAEDIFKNYKQINVRDTYCHYIEVLISDDDTLILLPKIGEYYTHVGVGILINSKKVSDEFADWFQHVVPEPNTLKLNEANIEAYRNEVFNIETRRNGCSASRCCLCNVPIEKQPGNKMKDILAKYK